METPPISSKDFQINFFGKIVFKSEPDQRFFENLNFIVNSIFYGEYFYLTSLKDNEIQINKIIDTIYSKGYYFLSKIDVNDFVVVYDPNDNKDKLVFLNLKKIGGIKNECI